MYSSQGETADIDKTTSGNETPGHHYMQSVDTTKQSCGELNSKQSTSRDQNGSVHRMITVTRDIVYSHTEDLNNNETPYL